MNTGHWLRRLCLGLVLLCPALAAAGETLPQFNDDLRSTLAPLAGGALTGVKLLEVSADVGPWLDTGVDLQPGERYTVLLRGRQWLSRHYDLYLQADMALWARVGDGPIQRGVGLRQDYRADHGGRLMFKHFPGRWLNPSGAYAGDPPPINLDAGGATQIAVLQWAASADPAAVLAQLADAATTPDWLRQQLRPVEVAPPPAGWRYLWELGPSGIFQAGKGRIDVRTAGDVGILQKEVSVALTEHTQLSWQWLVEQLPAQVREDSALSHDYLSIAVEFDNGQDLTWMWSYEIPVGEHFRCPLAAWTDRETHWVLRSGTRELGRWQSEQRSIAADYRAAVGGELPKRIVRVWLIANSVFMRQQGRASFREIQLGEPGQRISVD